MSDIALHWDVAGGAADLAIRANDLAADGGLETAVLLSLFTDRRAADDEPLPAGETDRRGWWADAVPVVEGDQIGSRLWLLARAKDSAETRQRAEEYAREALRWLVADKVVEGVEVVVEVVRPALVIRLELKRPGADVVRYRFSAVWTAQEI